MSGNVRGERAPVVEEEILLWAAGLGRHAERCARPKCP